MKLIGIDYGKRRVGIAVTDETGAFIRGLPTIDRKQHPSLYQALDNTIRQENPAAIVVGLPLGSDDGETAMSLEVRSFAKKLSRQTSLPVHFVDESLTSRRAYDIIRDRRRKHRRGKENTDRIAACLILEAFQKEQQ